nr:MAG TPA: hypothetical protein [Caudoviricetes sp.]
MTTHDKTEKTMMITNDELKYTSSIYSLIGRRFLNKYNVDRFYYHLIGKTEVREFAERLIAKVSSKLKVYTVRIKETHPNDDKIRMCQTDSIRTCRIVIVNTETCKQIYYLIDFTLYSDSISYSMMTEILPGGFTSDDLVDDTDDQTEEDVLKFKMNQ